MGSRLFVWLLFCLAVAAGGCNGAEPVIQPSGELTGSSGCKADDKIAQRGDAAVAPGSSEACIQYSYTRRSGLSIRHINAGFNCCPGELTADVAVDQRTISIIEGEADHGCRCLCLYDVDIIISDLKPAVYTVEVVEPYLSDGNERFEFTINLATDPQGEICISRSGGPWR